MSKVTLIIMVIYFSIADGVGFFVPLPVLNNEMTPLEVHRVRVTQIVLPATCIFGLLGLLVVAFSEIGDPSK